MSDMSGPKRNKTVHVDSEERTGRTGAAAFLRELADRVEGGSVVLKQGEREVTAQVPDQVTLEVSLDEREKGTRGRKWSLEVELEWYEGDASGEGVELG